MPKKTRVRTLLWTVNMLKGPKGATISKSKNIFWIFYCISKIYIKAGYYAKKKNETPRLFGSEIIDCKKRSYLNAQKTLCQDTYGQSTS